jgi:flavin reductase (DIM6/NTAB) family NADH-FMN oxidoreductase RutF
MSDDYNPNSTDSMFARVLQRMEGPDHWIIYAEVEQGNVADTQAGTAVHHRKVGNHY